jgi:hypothetical protein
MPSPGREKEGEEYGGVGYCEVNSYSNFEQCGTTGFDSFSFCYLDVEGGYQCVANALCTVMYANPCASNSDCDQDWACVAACNVVACIPLCSNSNGPFGSYYEDLPYYDDNHNNDVCFSPDYIASAPADLPLSDPNKDLKAETALSSLMASLPSLSPVTSVPSSSSAMTSILFMSLLSPLNVALALLITLSAVAVLTLVRFVFSAPQRPFSQLSSSSEHSFHLKSGGRDGCGLVLVELERVSRYPPPLVRL